MLFGLLGAFLKPLGKKVAQAVLGPAHVNAAAQVTERTLVQVVFDLLEPYGVDEEQAGHLSATLLYSLSRAAETGPTDDVFDAEARPATVRRLLDVLRDSPDFDADTFQVYVDGGTVPVDVAMVLDEFLTRLPRKLQLAAEEDGSKLANLVIQRRFTAITPLVRSPEADGEEIARTARNRIANDIARRRHRDAGDRVLINSSALTEWADYAGTASWRHGVGHRVAALAVSARNHPELRAHAAALDGFDASGTFVSVVVRLGRLPLGAMLAAVRTALSHLDPEDDGDRPLRRELLGLRADLRWLRSEVDEPRFRACFACVGSWGSGRSRLVTELAETAVSDGDFALFLRPAPAETSLEAHVLTGAGRLFARPFASLEDLGRFLDQVLGADLHLLLDDADEWCAGRAGALDDLQDTIAAATAHDRLRWTLTAEHSRFHALLSDDRSRARFWPAYVWASVMDPGPEEWLDLDASNVRQSIGLQLLEDHGPPGIRAELAELGRDPASFRYETTLLSAPLVAWLHVDPDPDGAGNEHPAVVDVHAGAVIRRFWDRRKVALGRGDREQTDALDQVVLLLARHYAAGAPRTAPLRDVLGVLKRPDAAALLQRPTSARALLMRLSDAGVLQVTSEGDAELDLPEEIVTPRLAPLWAYRIARPLTDTAQRDRVPSQAFLSAARPFLADGAAGEPLDAAVCEIGLRLLAEGPASPRAKKDVWTRWLDDPDAPKPPAWLAAVGSPPAAQGAVAGWLAHHEHEPAGKREWFALLRLLAGAETVDWQAQQRLAVVSRTYARIGGLGLGPYLEWVIGRIVGDLELCTTHNYAAVLGRLTGTELADAADAAAGAVTAPALEIFRDDCFAWLRNVEKFLKTVTVAPSTRRADDTDSARPYVHTFWQHLVRAVVGRVVDRRGLEAFDELAAAGWYSGNVLGIDRRVDLRMREEANAALGHWYQEHARDRNAVAAYLRLVTTLVDRRAPDVPTDRQRAVAFYLIRHSERTGREPTKVKEHFHPLLSVLCADPDLADLPHLRGTCMENGFGEDTASGGG
ncbi:hypothetical protein GCM10010531_38780 [Blastococcus jejuensis]|uniref:AAA ATPase domain-containing protein n=2 Tax=Blastococcus jejuensis TaxID=351224 RepID=A0ABP6PJY9_9ACTN